MPLFILGGQLLARQKFRFWHLYLPQSWKPKVLISTHLSCDEHQGSLKSQKGQQCACWVMESRRKEEPAILQEPQVANPKRSLQTGTGAGESETEGEERKLREEGTVQEASAQNNLRGYPDWELFCAFTHGMWAQVILMHSFSVTKPLMSAGDKNGPSVIISIPKCTQYRGFYKKHHNIWEPYLFQREKITKKHWSESQKRCHCI